jgi:hypothetical protein
MSQPGPICYVEIGTTDLPKTAKFYMDIFNWQVTDPNSRVYSTFSTGDGIGGGLYNTDQVKPGGGIIIYVAVEDIAATLARITAAGGRVLVPKTEIPGTGWYGHFADPVGNHLGLFTPNAG